MFIRPTKSSLAKQHTWEKAEVKIAIVNLAARSENNHTYTDI